MSHHPSHLPSHLAPQVRQPNAPLSASTVKRIDVKSASDADIAKRAYDIYVKAGRKQGHCNQNWLQAEGELRKQAHAGSCCS